MQEAFARMVVNDFNTSMSEQSYDLTEFDSVIDALDNMRTEKNYDWQSNIAYPQYPSLILTEASQWANQYFQSRDFVEVRLEDDRKPWVVSSRAAKKILNKTLNRRDLYYYHKYIRARMFNSTAGKCYAVCWWEKKRGENGKLIKDQFGMDIVDIRDVATSSEYCYSLQQKQWVTIASEKSYADLVADQETHGYFNLDKVLELVKGKSKSKSRAASRRQQDLGRSDDYKVALAKGNVFERYGKMWMADVQYSEDEEQIPISCEVGMDSNGAPVEGAKWMDGISTVFEYGGKQVLIRYQPTPFVDEDLNPYKPVLRGLCYIHPTKDEGMSDGKYVKDLQVGINDTLNISNDRVMLATLPVMKGRKFSIDGNDEAYIEPEHIIPLDDPNDLVELTIRDNIAGAMNQMSTLIKGSEQVTSIFPTTMGELPEMASTTATAIAGAESRTNLRANYKSLTFENTFLNDQYWMILQMTNRFMSIETAEKFLDKEEMDQFSPDMDYTYQPVSSNIEQEYSKANKLRMIDQLVGRVVNVPNPKTPALLNMLISKFADLLGPEYADIKNAMLDQGPAGQAAAMGGAGEGYTPPGDAITGMVNASEVPATGPMVGAMNRGGDEA